MFVNIKGEEMKNNKKILAMYVGMIILIIFSVFNTSLVSQLDNSYVIENNIDISSLNEVLRWVSVTLYIPTIGLVVLGCIFCICNVPTLNKMNYAILLFVVVSFIIETSSIDSKVLSEDISGDKKVLSPEVELVLEKQTSGQYNSFSDYIENIIDISY